MRRILMSFASRLTFYILTLTALIFLCIVVVFHRYSRLREEKQAVRYTSVLQEKLIQEVDFELEEVENSVRSKLYRVKRMKDDPDDMMPIVRGLVREDSLIMGASIAFVRNYYPEKGERFMEYAYLEEQDGQQHLVTKHLGRTDYHYLNMRWFTDAVKQRKGVWSEPYFDSGGANTMMTTFACPVMDDEGLVFAVVTADVSLEDLSLNIFSIRPYPDSYSFIISREGTYLSHPDRRLIMHSTIFSRARQLDNEALALCGRKMLSGGKGSFRSNLQDTDVLVCYAPLVRTGWSICSICPYRTVMTELGSAFGMMVLIMLCGLVLLSLCIRILVKYTVRPIRQLTEATHQIAKGNFDCPLPDIHTKDDLRLLHDAFEHMQRSLLEYIQRLKTTTQQKERIESELTIAHDIQMSIVPKSFSPFPDCDSLELYAILKPAREVGGDLYDFFIRDDKLFFCVGDVSGKGIPASLVMAITSTLFRMTAKSYDSPYMIVTKLNDTIADSNEANMFVTMFVGVLDLYTGVLTYCNAGHNPPVLVDREGGKGFLQVKPNLPIGVMRSVTYELQQTTLKGDQSLLVYTDGLTEAENARQELFGEQRALESAARNASCTAEQIVRNIHEDLTRYVDGAEQSDDITLLCIRLNAEHSMTLTIGNDVAETKELASFIASMADRLQWPEPLTMSLNLALEEVLVNAVLYAYPKGTKGMVSLKARWQGVHPATVVFELEDEGVPFDPTRMEEADVTLSVEDRPIGGLGIFLTRKLMDDISYRREGGKNRLMMVKHIPREE